MRITNPLRDIVDQLRVPEDPPKPLISLSIGTSSAFWSFLKWSTDRYEGDPTVFGNLLTSENITDRLADNIKTGKYNGYAHSAGYESESFSLHIFLFSHQFRRQSGRRPDTHHKEITHYICRRLSHQWLFWSFRDRHICPRRWRTEHVDTGARVHTVRCRLWLQRSWKTVL